MRPVLVLLFALASCGRLAEVGRTPDLSAGDQTSEYTAMVTSGLPISILPPAAPEDLTPASLWTGNRESLLGDRRAIERGDILTVVIDINDSAQLSNSTDRARSGSENLGIQSLFGLPEMANGRLATGATLDPAVQLGSTGSFNGNGSVRRNEQLTLRVAATILEVLPNGILSISGSQEVRVNNEVRELLVTGYVRPEDISRQNEITYDKIASARISYGGRGLLSDVQRPRWGQEATDHVLPF